MELLNICGAHSVRPSPEKSRDEKATIPICPGCRLPMTGSKCQRRDTAWGSYSEGAPWQEDSAGEQLGHTEAGALPEGNLGWAWAILSPHRVLDGQGRYFHLYHYSEPGWKARVAWRRGGVEAREVTLLVKSQAPVILWDEWWCPNLIMGTCSMTLVEDPTTLVGSRLEAVVCLRNGRTSYQPHDLAQECPCF